MRVIEKALGQLKGVLRVVVLFNSFISSLIVLLLFALVFIFFAIPVFLAGIPFVIYLAYNAHRGMRSLGLKDVEEKVPDLRWRLRTAADNLHRKDMIVNDLNRQVVEDMKKVRSSYFLSGKSTSAKVLAAAVLSVLIILVSIFDVHFDDFNDVIDKEKITGMFGGGIIRTSQKEADVGYEEGDLGDILGEESYAESGKKEEELKLSQIGGLVDVNKYGNDLKSKDFKKYGSLPGDYKPVADSSFDEKISDKDEEVVKNYFDKING